MPDSFDKKKINDILQSLVLEIDYIAKPTLDPVTLT
jgi:hypothetical protein